VNGPDIVVRESIGHDAGNEINGRKRFIVTGPSGVLITVFVLPASMHDRPSMFALHTTQHR
jgi:hypothetical protein